MLLVKPTKKIIYALIVTLVVVSGLVFANRVTKNAATKKVIFKPLSVADRKAALKKWEASPDGLRYKEWEASPAGKKVYAGAAKLRRHIRTYDNMEAVVTSLSFPPGSRLGFGMMININGDDYILAFGPEFDTFFSNFNNEFLQLHSLKVNDKIIIRSRNVSYAPKYAYPIISGDYVEQDGKILYKRAPRKGGC